MAYSDRSQIGLESSKRARSNKPRRRRIPLLRMVCVGFGAMFIVACWRFAPPTGENARPIDDGGLTGSLADTGRVKSRKISHLVGVDFHIILVALDGTCRSDADCAAGNDCTDDRCANGLCTYPVRSGQCDDNN
ncbi:MAG: hypothetical protein IIB57_12475 [Planctomycetes bacterium]|nr:hypothetical protein [Planctomycetota bacterium]